MNERKSIFWGLVALVSIGVAAGVFSTRSSAHAIDYIAMNISPASTFNGASGNFTVTNPVAGGSNITFQLTYAVVTNGQTTNFPRAVTFGATTEDKPDGAPNVSVSGLVGHTFTSATGAGSSFTDTITITAPNVAGAYSVKIAPASGTSGGTGLHGGGGIVISFTVAGACTAEATNIATANQCIVYKSTSTTLSATLSSGGNPLAGKLMSFSVAGNPVGTATTDGNGVASLAYNPSGLGVGDHTVIASYAGEECAYEPRNASWTLGVTYMFIGFQQPINADGSSSFNGRTVPVKIKIADANGNPVPDAAAHVYFAFGMPTIVGTDAEPVANTNGDSGNRMRYVASDNQYIFNWDVQGLQNGTYTVRVDLGEGSCATAHSVVLSLNRRGR